MKKKFICLLMGALLLTGCGKVPKLKNGEDAVVSFNENEMISIDELYTEMKDNYALSILLNMIDKKVLEETFKDEIDNAKENAENYVKAIKESYDSNEELETAINQYGFASIDEYQDYIYLSYMKNHAMEEYAKSKITDKQIKNYYDENVEGDIEVSHILITPEVTDEMDDEAKEKAEKEAKDLAQTVLDTLKKDVKNGKKLEESFTELAKKYSKDDATKDKGGSLGRVNKTSLGDSYTELINAAYSIKDNTYYGSVITSKLGYHVIIRTKSYDKEELDKVKESIINTLSDELIENDSTISVNALQHYRKQMGMEIQDDKLKTQYSNYIQNQLSRLTSK